MRSASRPSTSPAHPDDRVGRRAVALGAAVGVFGISFGVLAVAAGLPPWLTILTSLVVLAGGSQFAFIAVIGAGGAPLAATISGLLLNLRFVPFGLALAPRLPAGSLPRRLLDSYLLVDESVALGLAGSPEGTARRFRLAGLAVVITWIGGTAIGAFGGQLLDPERFGLDAAFPAGFLALLSPWLRTRAGRVAAVTGALLALALTPVAPPGVPIVAAGLGALLGLRAADRPGKRGRDEDTPAARSS
jgi:predicted branched-subunit amino acid permease